MRAVHGLPVSAPAGAEVGGRVRPPVPVRLPPHCPCAAARRSVQHWPSSGAGAAGRQSRVWRQVLLAAARLSPMFAALVADAWAGPPVRRLRPRAPVPLDRRRRRSAALHARLVAAPWPGTFCGGACGACCGRHPPAGRVARLAGTSSLFPAAHSGGGCAGVCRASRCGCHHAQLVGPAVLGCPPGLTSPFGSLGLDQAGPDALAQCPACRRCGVVGRRGAPSSTAAWCQCYCGRGWQRSGRWRRPGGLGAGFAHV